MEARTWTVIVLLLAGLTTERCEGFLNLFLNSSETRRLLGIEGELYYVRNGTINDYALTFNLLIRPEHTDIFFSWQNVRPMTSLSHMRYDIQIEMEENEDVMEVPRITIPAQGNVPTSPSVFGIHLGCKGMQSAEVDIKIYFDVYMTSPTNKTRLLIKRRKSCLRNSDIGTKESGGTWFKPDGGNSTKDETDRRLSTTPTNIFYIAVGCACGVILLVALIVAIYYVRSSKASGGERLSETSSSKGLTTQTTQSFLRPETPNTSVVSMPVMKRGFSVTELKPSEVKGLLGEIHIERSHITLGKILMEGTFGRIYHGTVAVGEDDVEEEQDILIKTVSDIARSDQIDVLLKEGLLLKGFVSPCLLPIMAACVDNDLQPLLIYHYSHETNLKLFLQRCNVSDMSPHQSLSTQQYVYMAIQIARGVQFLHRRRVVHKDVACRNCVVDSQWVVKMTDNALSRDLFPNDYHCLGDNENRPIKWMPIEAIVEKKLSPASDVWAFGILLWELLLMGQSPYADIDPFEMSSYLQKGYRLPQPHNCPDELFTVMAYCWAMTAEERPKISQLQGCLQEFYQALGRFI